MRRAPPPSQHDTELFRSAVGPVAPLAREPEADVGRPRPPPRPAQTLADRRAVIEEIRATPLAEIELGMSEALSYTAPGVARRLLRRLGAGEFALRDEIDLHGMDLATAARQLSAFLARCRDEGRLCVRIVHGKGHRSLGAAPLLKAMTDRLLRQRRDVLAFRSARASEGGGGAVVVLLRP